MPSKGLELLSFSVALQKGTSTMSTSLWADRISPLDQNRVLQFRNQIIYLGSNTQELPLQQRTQPSRFIDSFAFSWTWASRGEIRPKQSKDWNGICRTPRQVSGTWLTEPDQGQNGRSLFAVVGPWEFWADVNRMNTYESHSLRMIMPLNTKSILISWSA